LKRLQRYDENGDGHSKKAIIHNRYPKGYEKRQALRVYVWN